MTSPSRFLGNVEGIRHRFISQDWSTTNIAKSQKKASLSLTRIAGVVKFIIDLTLTLKLQR
jgi:hypothetical protein